MPTELAETAPAATWRGAWVGAAAGPGAIRAVADPRPARKALRLAPGSLGEEAEPGQADGEPELAEGQAVFGRRRQIRSVDERGQTGQRGLEQVGDEVAAAGQRALARELAQPTGVAE